ncbi:MAG: integration host factor subunit beta [Planctomycetota bacterium]|jgi:integration host factor subunit beta|nr:integration host factor subunit beta [Planctomycetota bacterium]
MTRQTIAKRTIAERIAERLGIGQTQSLQVIQAFLDEIIDELAKGNRLEFRDFGVFETVERKPRMALNPKTLEKVPVGRKMVVKFKVGRLMKERVAALGDEDIAAITGESSPSAPPAPGAPPPDAGPSPYP